MKWLGGLGPFDAVLDVGGNLGDFAEACWTLWRDARITSFEPIPPVASRQRDRAEGRWGVEEIALSNREGTATLRVCVNQHTASTMQEPGKVRRDRFGIADRFREITVQTNPLDAYCGDDLGRLLVKIDVEGHEYEVIEGARKTLGRAAAVVVEVQQHPDIFVGSAAPSEVDWLLRDCGLEFAGVLASLADPAGLVVQFDGLWMPAA